MFDPTEYIQDLVDSGMEREEAVIVTPRTIMLIALGFKKNRLH